MKLSVNQEAAKRKRKRKRQEFFRKILVILIGYPFVFPIEKLKEFAKNRKEVYYLNRLDKLRDKAISEMLRYIAKDWYHYDSYVVYNAYQNDDIDYANAFYLHCFLGYGGHRYRQKDNPWSKLYYKLIIKKKKSDFDSNVFYQDFFRDLKEALEKVFEDITIREGEEKPWGRTYPMLTLKLKDDANTQNRDK